MIEKFREKVAGLEVRSLHRPIPCLSLTEFAGVCAVPDGQAENTSLKGREEELQEQASSLRTLDSNLQSAKASSLLAFSSHPGPART